MATGHAKCPHDENLASWEKKWNLLLPVPRRQSFIHLNAIKCTESLLLLGEGVLDTELQALLSWLFSGEMGFEQVLIWNRLPVCGFGSQSFLFTHKSSAKLRYLWHMLGCTTKSYHRMCWSPAAPAEVFCMKTNQWQYVFFGKIFFPKRPHGKRELHVLPFYGKHCQSITFRENVVKFHIISKTLEGFYRCTNAIKCI